MAKYLETLLERALGALVGEQVPVGGALDIGWNANETNNGEGEGA